MEGDKKVGLKMFRLLSLTILDNERNDEGSGAGEDTIINQTIQWIKQDMICYALICHQN